jgi:uncharacterized protein (DUF983 family)
MDIRAMVRGACPRCGEGAIFRAPVWRGALAMHERCPACGLKFEREPGYFLGALYVSYLASIPPVLVLMMFFWQVLKWRFDLAVVAAFVAYIPAVPFVTRAARVVWMHLDRHFDP